MIARAGTEILGEITTVRMFYGVHLQEVLEGVREAWQDDSIEILNRTEELGNFRFDHPDIDRALDATVERIVSAARGRKVLVIAVVTRPQVEILERLHGRIRELPGTTVIALLFKEPYLLPAAVYDHRQFIVVGLSAFPSFQTAVDVLFGEVVPKPAQYSSLNRPGLPISRTGGAPVEPNPAKELHLPHPPPAPTPAPPPPPTPAKPWLPAWLTSLLAALLGSLAFLFVYHFSTRRLTPALAVTCVLLGLTATGTFLLLAPDKINWVIEAQITGSRVQHTISFVLAFLADALWIAFTGPRARTGSGD